jgi:2-polyprenyl-6-hydroxyphenyl methylase/3-demethylubiquinone-9 3-methyltransferase
MNEPLAPTAQNVDPAELARFDGLAQRWWDSDGEFAALHRLNPVRLAYIASRSPLRARRALDVGCGGGILTEALAREGARVCGIDLAAGPLQVAELHALAQGLSIEYRRIDVEALATEQPGAYDVLACMEMLEHVPDPARLVRALATLVRPGGSVFVSTINRNLKSFALAIVGAEYVLRLLPRGTHTYARFLRPSELARFARAAGLELADISGLSPALPGLGFRVSADPSVNYLAHLRRPGPP